MGCSTAARATGTAMVLLALALAVPGRTAQAAGQPLRGEAFSSPAIVTPMPRAWIAKPIAHDPAAAKADVSVVLDQGAYPALLPFIQEYAKARGLRITVTEGTCGISAGALARKAVDIGGFCCPPGKEDRLPGLRFHTLGIASIAFFVNPANPIDDLTTRQLRDIYRGRIYRWSELTTASGTRGPAAVIRAIGRLHCKLRPGHWKLLLRNENQFSPRMSEVGSIPDMIAQVGAYREAIGWEVLSMIARYRDVGTVKVLQINGVDPRDGAALASLRYPFYRVYDLTTWEGKNVENPDAQDLVRYLQKRVDALDTTAGGFASARALRKAGWQFAGDELIAEPLRGVAP